MTFVVKAQIQNQASEEVTSVVEHCLLPPCQTQWYAPSTPCLTGDWQASQCTLSVGSSKKNLELVSSILYHSPSSLWSTYAQKALIAFLERRAFLIYLHNRIEHRLLHLLLTIILTGLKSIEECVTKKPKAFDDNGACQIANELRWSHTIWFSFPITVSFLAAVHDLSVLFLSFLSFLALSSVKCILVIIIFLPFIPAFGCQCCLVSSS